MLPRNYVCIFGVNETVKNPDIVVVFTQSMGEIHRPDRDVPRSCREGIESFNGRFNQQNVQSFLRSHVALSSVPTQMWYTAEALWAQ